jgi:CBS domain-containing protein
VVLAGVYPNLGGVSETVGAAPELRGRSEHMADNERRKEGHEGATPQQGAVHPLRGMTEAAQRGTAAGLEAARQAAGGAAGQANQVVQQLAEAAEVYRSVAQRIAEEARTLAGTPMAAAGGLQEVSQAWADWLRGAMETNTRFSQEVMRARSLPEIAQAHARFVEDSLTELRDGSTRVLEAAGGVADRALHQGEGDRGEEGEGEPVTVADVMTRDVRVASPEDTVQEAATLMGRADTGVLPVGEDDRIVGMLTDRDIAVRIVGAAKDPTKTKVREAMTPGVEYCFEDEEIDAVVDRMAEQRLRRLPVLSREKRLVGIVSLGDIATEQPDPGVAGRALGGIAQEGGPHRQRPARPTPKGAVRQPPRRKR